MGFLFFIIMIKYEIYDEFLNRQDYNQLVDFIMPRGHTPRTKDIHTINDVTWDFVRNTVTEVEAAEALYNEKHCIDESQLMSSKHLDHITDIKKLDPINNLFLCHTFWVPSFQSERLNILNPILSRIDPLAIFRIQANLTLQQKEKRRTEFHVDSLVGAGSMTTAIFYMNTTNGPTILEDGTEIECRENRLVTYPFDTLHAGVLCTDQPYRVVINLNYFK